MKSYYLRSIEGKVDGWKQHETYAVRGRCTIKHVVLDLCLFLNIFLYACLYVLVLLYLPCEEWKAQTW